MNSSNPILPERTLSPIVPRYSWIFSITISVASPDKIWLITYLVRHIYISKGLNSVWWPSTYWETLLDNVQYSRRFISRPLTSTEVRLSSSILTAAYFFFCNRRRRWKTPSRSISSSLYCSLTCFLNSAEILSASAKSVTFEFTKTESVSP